MGSGKQSPECLGSLRCLSLSQLGESRSPAYPAPRGSAVSPPPHPLHCPVRAAAPPYCHSPHTPGEENNAVPAPALTLAGGARSGAGRRPRAQGCRRSGAQPAPPGPAAAARLASTPAALPGSSPHGRRGQGLDWLPPARSYQDVSVAP